MPTYFYHLFYHTRKQNVLKVILICLGNPCVVMDGYSQTIIRIVDLQGQKACPTGGHPE